MSASNPRHHDLPTVPCKTCGDATTFTGTKLCSPCWEVESRLTGYLVRGGWNAIAFVESEIEAVKR